MLLLWAETAAQGVRNLLECYSSRLLLEWNLLYVPADPDVWTDGSVMLD